MKRTARLRLLPVWLLCGALALLAGCGVDEPAGGQSSPPPAASSAPDSAPESAPESAPAGQPVQVQDDVNVGNAASDGAVIDVDLATGSAVTTAAPGSATTAASGGGTTGTTTAPAPSGGDTPSGGGEASSAAPSADDPDRETMSGFTPWE